MTFRAAPVYCTLSELATEFGVTRDRLRTALQQAGVAPAEGTPHKPLYRLRDVLQAVFVPAYRCTLSRDDA